MKRVFKAFGLTLVAVCALGAVMASGASAAEFTAFNTTTNLHEGGTAKGTDLSEPAFTVNSEALQVKCATNTYEGKSATGTEPTPKVKPTYTACNAFLFGGKVGSATVNTTGCEYEFHIAAGGGPDVYTGTTSIVCPAGVTGIDITTSNGCEFVVPAAKNTAVNGNTYRNTTETKPTEVDVETSATNVHTTVVKGGALNCGIATGATATAGTMKSNVKTKAFNSKGEQIDLTVM